MKTKKLLLNALPLLLIGTAMVYAAAPSGGYLPGATTDPACAPGDTDCVVQVPVAEDELPVTGSGILIKTSDGSVIWGEVKGSSPVGTVSWFAGANAPAGWFIANGSTISRTTYADLYAVIGETYGAGDGTSTFTLPDLRGEFVRGIDSGRGVDAGRILGSNQNASKVLKSVTTQGGSYSEGAFAGARYQADINLSSNLENTTSTDTNSTSDATGGGSINTRNTFGEVRPRNIAMTPIIKWALPAGDTNVSGGGSGTDNQTLTLSGSNLSIRDGNMVNLSGLSGTNIWSQTGSTTYYNNGNVGIGTTTPNNKLHVYGSELGIFPGIVVDNRVAYGDGVSNETSRILMSLTEDAFMDTNNRVMGYIESGVLSDATSDEGFLALGTRNLGVETEKVRIMNDGNVGIGTTSPEVGLQINKSVNGGQVTALAIVNPNSSTGTEVSIDFGVDNTSLSLPNARISAINTDSSSVYPTDLSFSAWSGGSFNENLRIKANGNVGIGTTSPEAVFTIQAIKSWSDTTPAMRLIGDDSRYYMDINPYVISGGNVGYSFKTYNESGVSYDTLALSTYGNVGIGTTSPSYKLHVNGSVAGVGAYVNTSDRRLKQDFENLENPLEKLLKIKGLTFDWKRDENPEMDFPQGRDLGVVAQDVEKVFPEAVVQDDDGIFSVAYSKLIAPIIEAIRELVFENERQDAEIETLKNENIQLKEQIQEGKEQYISLEKRMKNLEDK